MCPGALLLARANLGQGTHDSPESRWQDSKLSQLWSHPQESIAGQGKQQPDSALTPQPHTGRLRPSTGAAVWAAEWRGRRAKRGKASGPRTLGKERLARSPQHRTGVAAPQMVSLYESTSRRTTVHSWGRQRLLTFVIKSSWFHITGRKAELIQRRHPRSWPTCHFPSPTGCQPGTTQQAVR